MQVYKTKGTDKSNSIKREEVTLQVTRDEGRGREGGAWTWSHHGNQRVCLLVLTRLNAYASPPFRSYWSFFPPQSDDKLKIPKNRSRVLPHTCLRRYYPSPVVFRLSSSRLFELRLFEDAIISYFQPTQLLSWEMTVSYRLSNHSDSLVISSVFLFGLSYPFISDTSAFGQLPRRD